MTARLLAVVAINLRLGLLMCGDCVYTIASFREAIGQGIAEQIRENTKGKTLVWIFTDSEGKERAEIPLCVEEPNAEPTLRVRCLDGDSVWKPDFKKSVDFSRRGYVSTTPAKMITSWPLSLPVTLPAAKTQGLVLVDGRWRVRDVLLSPMGTDQDLLKLPFAFASRWVG